MVTRQNPHLSPGDIAEIHREFGSLFADVQELQDPPAIVTFRRRDLVTSVFADVIVDVQLIRIGFGEDQENTRGENTGLVTTTNDGELKGFSPLPIQRDDQFVWGGQVCIVTAVFPERFNVVRAAFVLAQGNQP